jgi:hypothetical protein
MSIFSCRGITAATAATADHALAALWNPDSLKRIKVIETGLFKGGAGASADSVYICRITARGTAGSTVTPTASNAWDGDDSPMSGSLLDLAAYSGQPTRAAAPYMFGWVASAVAGSGIIWPTPRGISVPPGTGLCIAQRVATAWPISEVYFVWEE